MSVADNDVRHILLMRDLQESFGNGVCPDALHFRAKVLGETQILLQRAETLCRCRRPVRRFNEDDQQVSVVSVGHPPAPPKQMLRGVLVADSDRHALACRPDRMDCVTASSRHRRDLTPLGTARTLAKSI